MNKYLTYFGVSFRSATAYKFGLFLGIFVDIIFFVIQFTVWKTVFASSGRADIAGYNLSSTITYFFITNMIFRFDFMNSIYLGWQIWSGQLTNDIIKPWRMMIPQVVDAISDNLLALLVSIPVLVILYFAVRDYLVFPTTQYFWLFLVTLIIGFTITILISLVLQSLTFFFGDQDANIDLYKIISDFLAGAFVPLVFLPASLQQATALLPFKFTFFLPCEVFLQKISIPELMQNWLIALAWIVILLLILRFSFTKGLKHYTGTGR